MNFSNVQRELIEVSGCPGFVAASLSVTVAILMILELNQPFGGFFWRPHPAFQPADAQCPQASGPFAGNQTNGRPGPQ